MTAERVGALGPLRAGVDLDQARDAICMSNSVNVWRLLTLERGWSGEQYAEWVGRAMADAVLGPEDPYRLS